MQNKEFCFCAVSLGAIYRKLAVDLARNLETVAPGSKLVVVTDKAQEFDGIANIIALQHNHTFGYRPYNDKVFALEAALQRFPIAVQMDVDATFNNNIEAQLSVNWQPGISARFESMLAHTEKFNRNDLDRVKKIAKKLNISLDSAQWVGEALFVVREDGGKERDFLKCWKQLAHYWDIHKLGAKDGTPIGLAAASVGWKISEKYWHELNACLMHMDIHRQLKDSASIQLKKQWLYRLKVLRSRLYGLRNVDFFYG